EGEQPRLEEQAVPLKPEERLSHHAEREITRPQQRKRRRLRHARHHQQRERTAPPAEQPESSIPRPQPADRGKQSVRGPTVQRAGTLEEGGGGERSEEHTSELQSR